MKILLLGKNGQVGWELNRTLRPLGDVIALDRHEADLSNPDRIVPLVAQFNPDIIVNAAAYTAVDRAESEEDLAMRVNAVAVGALARSAKHLDALLIHYSTDYVFDGAKKEPYAEQDIPHPLNVYGKSKLAGESAIQSSGCSHLIFRTSWVFGSRGHNFLRTMLQLARSRPELKVVDDQHGAPTWSRMIAESTALVLGQVASGTMPVSSCSGVYHLTCAGKTSWYGFAREIIEGARIRGILPEGISAVVKPVSSSEYPVKSLRPANSVLSSEKLKKSFGISLPAWDICVGQVLDELSEQIKSEI